MIAKVLSRIGIEVWKDIPEFENYQVSNLGNVKSLNYGRTRKAKVLMKHINNTGRYTLNLYKQGKMYPNRNISVLVSQAFLSHKPNGYKLVVDHIDNNKINDKLYNLQLISQRKNASKDRKGTSKYTGVSKKTGAKKWTAQIVVNGKVKHLGLFTEEKKAAETYKNELKKINESKSTTL